MPHIHVTVSHSSLSSRSWVQSWIESQTVHKDVSKHMLLRHVMLSQRHILNTGLKQLLRHFRCMLPKWHRYIPSQNSVMASTQRKEAEWRVIRIALSNSIHLWLHSKAYNLILTTTEKPFFLHTQFSNTKINATATTNNIFSLKLHPHFQLCLLCLLFYLFFILL